jgi:hypothetical protein
LLAADAVQQAGSGHPGTAMSLAPLAYLLFQQVMVHDPGDDQWLGRDRFVLSAGHTSLTLYIQLFMSGYGLQIEDLRALRTWGSKTPGHPEYRHTRGAEITTGPLGQGFGAAVGMAMAARRERGLLDPEAAPGCGWCPSLRRPPARAAVRMQKRVHMFSWISLASRSRLQSRSASRSPARAQDSISKRSAARHRSRRDRRATRS